MPPNQRRYFLLYLSAAIGVSKVSKGEGESEDRLTEVANREGGDELAQSLESFRDPKKEGVASSDLQQKVWEHVRGVDVVGEAVDSSES